MERSALERVVSIRLIWRSGEIPITTPHAVAATASGSAIPSSGEALGLGAAVAEGEERYARPVDGSA